MRSKVKYVFDFFPVVPHSVSIASVSRRSYYVKFILVGWMKDERERERACNVTESKREEQIRIYYVTTFNSIVT